MLKTFERATTQLRSVRKISAVVIFCIATTIVSRAQSVHLVATFDGSNGTQPVNLVQGFDGNLYGETSFGGTYNGGSIFQVTPTPGLTSLYSFCAQIVHTCTDGSTLQGGALVQTTDGNLYGTAGTGGGDGQTNYGTIFRITPSGQLTTIHSFAGSPSEGAIPQGLVQGADGNFYGVTDQGGANCYTCGTFYKATPQGEVSVLYNFCSLANCADGSNPLGVTQATNGNFYGTTLLGGTNNLCGTIFEVTTGGQLITLHNFNQSDGCSPLGPMIQGTDGNFYGTAGGGAHHRGVVFKITAAGKFTRVYSFCSQEHCPDGAGPNAPLLQATDGNFYGTTPFGGTGVRKAGTIFKITPTGQLTTLYSFCHGYLCATGGGPDGGLLQGTDGNIYGTDGSFGLNGQGTVFQLLTGLSPFVKTNPLNGTVGTQVIIFGNGLTGTTSVSFNGTAATFSVVSSTEILASVPAGTTTGFVTVTTPTGTLKSNLVFRID